MQHQQKEQEEDRSRLTPLKKGPFDLAFFFAKSKKKFVKILIFFAKSKKNLLKIW